MQNKNVKYLETIKEIIGADQFQAIVEELPGAAIRIPSDPEHFNKIERNKQIRNEYYNGSPVSDLASKYDLKKSTIYKIIEDI